MLHIATVHFKSPRWIEIQARYLREHISVPFQTWASIEQIDASYASHFDHVVAQLGPHAGKLNHLAIEISAQAAADDLLMFLDGDAFPIAELMPAIEDGLSRAPLMAVRRAENFDEPQPHPCFCVTTVGTWRALPGDWSEGYTWISPTGRPRSDVGGNLLRQLQLTGTPWVPLLRSNRRNPDPIFFAVYGDIVYHHASGFRRGSPSGVHRVTSGPTQLPVPSAPLIGRLARTVNARRWRRWEHATQDRRMQQSQAFFEKIQAGGSDWLADLI